MPTPFVLTLPAGATDLQDEIEQRLAPHAEVHSQPLAFGLEEIKLIVEIVAGATTVLANGAAVATFLLMLKDRAKQTGKPSGIKVGSLGGRSIPLEDADEALLRRLLGLDDGG